MAVEEAPVQPFFVAGGAALPSDLIRDPRATPFHVGRRVELRDFTPEKARPFAGVVGKAALTRVLHWTGGHPFLTQALCAGLTSSPSSSGSSLRGGRGERSGLSIPQPLPSWGDRSRSLDPLLAGAKGRGAGEVVARLEGGRLPANSAGAQLVDLQFSSDSHPE